MRSPNRWRSLACKIVIVPLVVLVSGQRGSGQEKKRPGAERELPKTVELFATETIPISAPPPLLVVSGIKCDFKGNIYLAYSDATQAVLSQPDGIPTLPIQKLSPQSRTAVPYAIPSISEYQHLLRYDFAVDGHGKAYALISASHNLKGKDNARGASLIVKYEDDGTMDSFLEIGSIPGKEFVPLRFAAFPDGNFLIMGNASDPKGKHGAFAGIFDRGGNFASDIRRSEAIEPVHSGSLETVSGINGAFSVSAPDGNVYVLYDTHPLRLDAVSPAGYIVREFEITQPASGLSPTQMGMAGDDKVFIQFGYITTLGTPPENTNDTSLIEVLDTNMGAVTAVYRLPPSQRDSNISACAISQYEFLFLGTGENNKLKIVRYSPR